MDVPNWNKFAKVWMDANIRARDPRTPQKVRGFFILLVNLTREKMIQTRDLFYRKTIYNSLQTIIYDNFNIGKTSAAKHYIFW